jgi:choline dehydrogenase
MNRPEPIKEPTDENYEYIVVGSGAGGGPLAARLAMAGKKTLLIEAGDDQGHNINYEVPVFHAYSTEDKKMSWDFYVQHYETPERQMMDSKLTWETPDGKKHVGNKGPEGAKIKGVLYPRSGTLGGCTAHNAMVSVYPHERDWEYIENITGDHTWNPKNMRRLFQKLERLNYSAPSLAGHGKDGFLTTSLTDPAVGVADSKLMSIAMGSASVMSKGPVVDNAIEDYLAGDLNRYTPDRDNAEGLFSIPLAIRNGKRSSSRDIILEVYHTKHQDGRKKYPLHIALNTLATKVTFSRPHQDKPLKATGVEVLKGKYLYKASPENKGEPGMPGKYHATHEVILSGGAYNSPQLLKLSGIGPEHELKKHNIPLLVDLPGVGTNLQDHMEIGIMHEMPSGFELIEHCRFRHEDDPCMKEWYKNEGTYGQSNGFVFAALKKSSQAHKDKDFGSIPDLFLFGGPAAFRGYYPGYSNDVYRHQNWTWVVLKAHTANNAGKVTLRSADPRDPPHILFNYFDAGEPEAGRRDVRAMAEGVELGRKLTIAGTDGKAMGTTKPAGGSIREVLPGHHVKSDKEIEDYVKNESWSHHASCTNPIGADNDKMAVLDSKFRVRGVEGLRVVDASIFPRIPGFFVAVPIYMIAEKAAESILEGK